MVICYGNTNNPETLGMAKVWQEWPPTRRPRQKPKPSFYFPFCLNSGNRNWRRVNAEWGWIEGARVKPKTDIRVNCLLSTRILLVTGEVTAKGSVSWQEVWRVSVRDLEPSVYDQNFPGRLAVIVPSLSLQTEYKSHKVNTRKKKNSGQNMKKKVDPNQTLTNKTMPWRFSSIN